MLTPFCSEDSEAVTCDIGRISSGSTVTATLVAVPSRWGILANSAWVAGNEPDYPEDSLDVNVTLAGYVGYLPLLLQ